MANHKSTKKRARQNKAINLHHRSIRSKVKHVIKAVREGEDISTLPNALIKAQSVIDKAVKKHVLHKKTASRKISRLAKFIASKQVS